jgi:hypothetical protein
VFFEAEIVHFRSEKPETERGIAIATSSEGYGFAAETGRFLSQKVLCSRSQIGKLTIVAKNFVNRLASLFTVPSFAPALV